MQLVKKHGQLHARTLLSPLGAGYLRLSADATTLVDVVKVAGEAVGIVKADLRRRFANTGVWRFVYVLDPEWDDPPQQQAAALGSPRAMQGWAEHFSVSGAVLQVEWAHLHACRVAHLKSNPQRRTLPPHEFWPELLRAEASTVPVLKRCMCALLVVAFQNASVERDLSVLKLVSERACGQLGMERLSARCRAAIDGPVAEKRRWGEAGWDASRVRAGVGGQGTAPRSSCACWAISASGANATASTPWWGVCTGAGDVS